MLNEKVLSSKQVDINGEDKDDFKEWELLLE
jgi:hypothetical protein